MFGRKKLDMGVPVDKIVQAPGTHAEGGDRLATVKGLFAVVDHPFLHQVDDAVADHFGVDTQIPVVAQIAQHRVGNLADAELQGAAVLDQHRYVLPDPFGNRVHLRRRQLEQRLLGLDPGVDLADVDEAVAAGYRHLRIDLRDHLARRVASRGDDVHRDAERAVAVLIRRADHHQRGVQRQDVVGEQAGDLGQETGGVIGIALVHRLPAGRTEKQRVDLEQVAVLLSCPDVFTHGQDVHYLDVV